MKVSILGTEYMIETHKVSEDEYMKKEYKAGYCAEDGRLIVVADMSEGEFFPHMDAAEQAKYRAKVLRHEIVHAFLNESGLSDSASSFRGSWAKHEEMVDWIAIQLPKIVKACESAGCLGGEDMSCKKKGGKKKK